MSTRTILHADDDTSDVFLVRRALSRVRPPVRLADVSDGRQAIAYLSGTEFYNDRTRYPRPDLLLLDLKMPEIDGFEVLAWARAQPEYKDLPVLVLSSSDLEEDRARTLALGATGFLVKSPFFADLVEQIAVLLCENQPATETVGS